MHKIIDKVYDSSLGRKKSRLSAAFPHYKSALLIGMDIHLGPPLPLESSPDFMM